MTLASLGPFPAYSSSVRWPLIGLGSILSLPIAGYITLNKSPLTESLKGGLGPDWYGLHSGDAACVSSWEHLFEPAPGQETSPSFPQNDELGMILRLRWAY